MAASSAQQTSSVAQPAQQTAASFWPTYSLPSRRTEFHGEAFSRIYSFHAYNVGWNWTDKKRNEEWLGREISKLYEQYNFDAVGISEIFEVEYGDDENMNRRVEKRREQILTFLLHALAAASSSAGQPAKSENRKWLGRIDGHCMYIWHQSLNLITSDYISLNAENQPWRKSQYFCFHPADCTSPIHIYHAHCPSPGKVSKTGKNRTFKSLTRRRVVKSIWEHVSLQHSTQQQRLEVGVVQPDIPAVLVTGDWNLTQSQWKLYLSENLPNDVRPTVALVQSTICKPAKHGDMTIAINCCTFQDETPAWTTFSDAHDVVIAKVMLHGNATVPVRLNTNATQLPRNSATPAVLNIAAPPVPPAPSHSSVAIGLLPKPLDQAIPIDTASSSAEQPATRTQSEHANTAPGQLDAFRLEVLPAVDSTVDSKTAPPVPPAPSHSSLPTGTHVQALVQEVPIHAAHSSAEQPANIAADQLRAFDLQVPLTNTPLSAKLAENFAGLDPDHEDHEALHEFENTFMWGNVLQKPVPGHWDTENPSGVQRLEWVLELVHEQRLLHIQNMQYSHDQQFTDDDMKKIMNTWRNNTEIWMQPDNLARLPKMKNAVRHDFVKNRFGAMKFQLLGNEALVDHLIRFNLCGAVQPVVLQNFCRSWAAYKITPQHLKAQEMSEKQQPNHVRRAKRIWSLRRSLWQAEWVVSWVDEKPSRWYDLSASDKKLYDTFQVLQTELADVLKTPAGERYRGSGSYMNQMPALTDNP